MFVASELFLSDILDEYGQYPVSTDGGTWYPQQACQIPETRSSHPFFCIQG